ncbi:MAG: alpha/beta hydrolase [Bacteroidota bacterium]
MQTREKIRLALVITLGVLVFVYLLFAAFLYVSQDRFVFFPFKEITATPEAIGLQFEDVQLTTADGLRLGAWFIPADSTSVVLFCHGNGGNISSLLEYIKTLHRLGHSVFVFDYRGYGTSEGEPGEGGMYRDVEAAWSYLATERGFTSKKIVVVGLSLGGPVAAYIASQETPQALILQSTFTSLPAMAARAYPVLPVGLMLRYRYPTVEYLQRVACPVLIIHSQQDEVVPFEHGLALYGVARMPKEFLQISGGHNDGHVVSAILYESGIREFLTRVIR